MEVHHYAIIASLTKKIIAFLLVKANFKVPTSLRVISHEMLCTEKSNSLYILVLECKYQKDDAGLFKNAQNFADSLLKLVNSAYC